jgi:hypothetical protein
MEKVDRRDADDSHRKLDLQYAGIHVVEPFRLVGMPLQPQARHEGLVAADDDHDEEIGDHDHVDQAKDDQHDLLLRDRRGV